MTIVLSDKRHEPLARAFSRRVVAEIVSALTASPATNFDLNNLTQDQSDLIFDLCFNTLIRLDTPESIQSNGTDHHFQPMFSEQLTDPIVVIGPERRVHFHQPVDELIEEVLKEMRSAQPSNGG